MVVVVVAVSTSVRVAIAFVSSSSLIKGPAAVTAEASLKNVGGELELVAVGKY